MDSNLYPDGHPNHQYSISAYAYQGTGNGGSNYDKVTFLTAGTNFWFTGDVGYFQIWEYDAPGSMTGTLASSEAEIPLNQDIKLLQKFYDNVFISQNFRSNIENLESELKNNKYVKKIIDFIEKDKKRPISLPENIK